MTIHPFLTQQGYGRVLCLNTPSALVGWVESTQMASTSASISGERSDYPLPLQQIAPDQKMSLLYVQLGHFSSQRFFTRSWS